MSSYVVHFKSAEKLRIDLGPDGRITFEGDIARFEESEQLVFAVHMRDVICLRTLGAKVRQLQSHDED